MGTRDEKGVVSCFQKEMTMIPGESNGQKVKWEGQKVMMLQSQMSDVVGFWVSVLLWILLSAICQ